MSEPIIAAARFPSSPPILSDLVTDLQQALGDSYRIERELGGGGMSRVFLAVEASLKRNVVVKVLPPEMASEVSAARFQREMELTAQLQHPHILPVLGAGARGRLLYYVMPYIEGETLRHRLQKDGLLPVADAVRVLREVADALAYAHRHAVIHRDIKPENILLEDDHAVLGDFGIARALQGSAGTGLTGTGMSIGTAGYMAPEQVTGEKNIDARADVYALAVVGYEMLIGAPPFTGSPSAVMAAHMTTPPMPVSEMRPEVPAAISNAIARGLAKDPDERFQTAGAFRDALEAALSSGPITSLRPVSGVAAAARPKKRGPWLYVAGTALVVGAIAAAFFTRSRTSRALDANLVAIAPFEVLSPDLLLWKEGLVDVLARNLDGAGPLRTVSPSVIIRSWDGRADRESAILLGRRNGAQLAVFGNLEKFGGDSVRAAVTLVDAGTGGIVADLQRRESAARMDRLVDSLTVGLLRELGRTRPIGAVRLGGLGSSSLPAMKAFLQGEQYYRKTAWDSALTHYERAISMDSTFALALHRAANVRGWVNALQDTVAAGYSRRAAAHLGNLAPRESLIIVADSLGRSLLNFDSTAIQRRDRLFATADLMAARYANDPEVWYAVGEARYHYGGYYGRRETRQNILDAFARSIRADSGFAPAYIHAIELAFDEHDHDTAMRYLRSYNALASTDAHGQSMHLLERMLDPRLAGAPETQAQLDTTSTATLTRALQNMRLLTDSAEVALRLTRELATRTEGFIFGFDTAFVRFLPGVVAHYRGHAADARREFVERRRSRAVRQALDMTYEAAFLGLWPVDTARMMIDAITAVDTFALSRARGIWVQHDTARFPAARALLEERIRVTPTASPRPIAYLDAMWSLERGDTAGALTILAAIPDTLITDQLVRFTKARLLLDAGRPAEALSIVREPYPCPCLMNTLQTVLRGRAAEAVGEKELAVDAFTFVAAVWRNADPELQPYVEEARAALRRLGADQRKPQKL